MNRLEDLLLWQRQQQERLQYCQQERNELLSLDHEQLYGRYGSHESTSRFKGGEVKSHTMDFSDSPDRPSLSASLELPTEPDSSRESENISSDQKQNLLSDDIPIRTSVKDFYQLLQQKLESEKPANSSSNLPEKPKHKFLRKGEGLARFQGKLHRLKPPSKQKNSRPIPRPLKLVKTQEVKKKPEEKPTNVPPVSNDRMEIVSKMPTWASVFKSSLPSTGMNASGDSQDLEKRTKKEMEELRIFEYLEQHAANSSFCSTSSFVARLMEDSIKSTPRKDMSPSQNWTVNTINRRQLTYHIGGGDAFSENDVSGCEPIVEETSRTEQNYRFTEDIVQTNQANEKKVNDAVLTEKPSVRFITEPETVSADSSGNCEEESKPVNKLIEDQGWSDSCSCSSCNASESEAETDSPVKETPKSPENRVLEAPSKPETNLVPPARVSTHVETNPNNCGFDNSLLQNRLQELEKEISIFQKDNASLQKMKKQHEEEMAKFKKEQKEFREKLNEEREKMLEMVHEERQKLSRERHVFEKYMKRTRDQPTRKEREEIQALKEQVATLQEEVVRKDSRWSATQVRTHNRIQQLEKQVRELKEENEKLKQERDRLKKVRFTNSRPKPASNTKVIHVISEELGKLKVDAVIREEVPKKRSPPSARLTPSTSEDNNWFEESLDSVVDDVPQKRVTENVPPPPPATKTNKPQQLQPKPHSAEDFQHPGRNVHMQLKNMFELSAIAEEEDKTVNDTFHETVDVRDKTVFEAFQATMQEIDGANRVMSLNGGGEEDRRNRNVAVTRSSYRSYPSTNQRNVDVAENDSNVSEIRRSSSSYPSTNQRNVDVTEKDRNATGTCSNYRPYPSTHQRNADVAEEDRNVAETRSSCRSYPLTNQRNVDVTEKDRNVAEARNNCHSDPSANQRNADVAEEDRNVANTWSNFRSYPLTNQRNVDVVEKVSQKHKEFADFVETVKPNGTREKVYHDGRMEIWFPNGNVKKVSADKLITRVIYYNGDVREKYSMDGKEKYYYAETKTWHTTFSDGMEVLEFPDTQTERRFPDGGKEISYPNGCLHVIFPEGHEEWTMKDGTIIRKNKKEKILILPNGQREIHTADHKRREYPDGTVKFLFPDGRQETRYSNGRIRVKDKDGRVIIDTGVR